MKSKSKLTTKIVTYDTFEVNTKFTAEMLQDLRVYYNFDITEKMEYDITREMIYARRKRIIEKILNENTTNDNK